MVQGSGGSQMSLGMHREHNERLCAENERMYGLRGAPDVILPLSRYRVFASTVSLVSTRAVPASEGWSRSWCP